MIIRANKAEPKNKPKYNRSSQCKQFNIHLVLSINGNTNINPAETIAANNKYTV